MSDALVNAADILLTNRGVRVTHGDKLICKQDLHFGGSNLNMRLPY